MHMGNVCRINEISNLPGCFKLETISQGSDFILAQLSGQIKKYAFLGNMLGKRIARVDRDF